MFQIIDGKLTLDERAQRILATQTIPPRYGKSPAMQALPLIHEHNALPSDERDQRGLNSEAWEASMLQMCDRVIGLLSLLQAHPNATPAELRDRMQDGEAKDQIVSQADARSERLSG